MFLWTQLNSFRRQLVRVYSECLRHPRERDFCAKLNWRKALTATAAQSNLFQMLGTHNIVIVVAVLAGYVVGAILAHCAHLQIAYAMRTQGCSATPFSHSGEMNTADWLLDRWYVLTEHRCWSNGNVDPFTLAALSLRAHAHTHICS